MRQQKKFLSERKHTVLWNIIQEHLYLDVYEGIARNRGQINATAGGMIGEANRQANRAKIFYGLYVISLMKKFQKVLELWKFTPLTLFWQIFRETNEFKEITK